MISVAAAGCQDVNGWRDGVIEDEHHQEADLYPIACGFEVGNSSDGDYVSELALKY